MTPIQQIINELEYSPCLNGDNEATKAILTLEGLVIRLAYQVRELINERESRIDSQTAADKNHEEFYKNHIQD